MAALQFLAVILHYLPDFKKQVADVTVRAEMAEQAPTPQAPAVASQNPSSVPAAPPIPQADLKRAQSLFNDAKQAFRVGEYDTTMKKLQDIEGLLPGDPAVLQLKAAVLERQDQYADAIDALNEALQYRDLAPPDRAQIQKKIGQLSQFLASRPAPPASAGTRDATTRDMAGVEDSMRDTSGLRPGADLGIVDIRVKDSTADSRNLQVSFKSRPGTTISVEDVRVVAYFYEESADGMVDLVASTPASLWLSPPVNWKDDEPELLNLRYTLSKDSQADGRKYYGYVVGVYYKNELQDFRADPPKLLKDFPLSLLLNSKDQ